MESYIDDKEHLDVIIKDLEFSYLETYSIMRNHMSKMDRILYKKLEDKKFSGEALSENEVNSFELLSDLHERNTTDFKSILFDTDKQLSSQAVATNRFNFNETITNRLMTILSIPYETHASWMCPPIYRDAIIFRDENNKNILSLEICFGCDAMIIDKNTGIVADEKTYPKLRELFIEIGHDVSNDPR